LLQTVHQFEVFGAALSFWLVIIFASFSLFSPLNVTVFTCLLLFARATNDVPRRRLRSQPDTAAASERSSAKPASRWTRPDIKHTSVYLPEAAYEALRQVAFDERCKIHDLLMEGVELALKKRGYPKLADMKTKWQREER